jgi:PAS domain S-box-containing protein
MITFEVLLVGDAPSRSAVREAFPERLVETTTAEGFGAAIEAIEGGTFDCVVSDYTLPEWDGIELLSEIRDREPTLPFVLYTADGDERVAQAAIDADVTAYVPHSVSEPEAEAVVDRAVEAARRYYVAETVPESDPMHADYRLKELAMDEAPVGITIADATDPEEPLIYVNEAFERITGYDAYDILGTNCRFLQGEETDQEAVTAMRNAIDDERPISVELLNYRKDGEPFWNQVNIAPIRDEDGDVTHLAGFQADVTERKEVELEASRQAEKLRADRRTRKRLLARIDGLVRRVTEATVDATSRNELERRVAEAFVDTKEYAAV